MLTSFSRDGLVFDVTDAGPPDGPVVVLLHGFPANRHSWNEVTPALNAAGLRTLAPDQRGYSPGARPRGRRAYRRSELVADVLALIEASGAREVHLVGHDWGGFVAWALAAAAPDRLSGMTVLSTPHPAALVRAMFRSDQALRSSYIAFVQLPRLPEAVLRRRLPRLLRASRLPEEIIRSYLGTLDPPGALTAALNWYRALRMDAPRGPSARVSVPTGYVWGARDPFLGRKAAEFTGSYVDGPYRFREVPAGHWLPERAAAVVAEEILLDVRGVSPA